MLKTKETDGKIIVYLEGRLDVSVSNEVEEGLTDLIENQGKVNIILNMSGVDYMSSSGFRACISTLRKLNAKEGKLKISHIRPAVKRIFDVIELTSLFDIYETDEDALKSF